MSYQIMSKSSRYLVILLIMDIIKLYESNKPYDPAVTRSLNEEYQILGQ